MEITYTSDAARLSASTRPVLRRRLVTIPTIVLATLLGTALAPALLPIAFVADLLAAGRLSATRTLLFFVAFLWAETIGLLVALWIWVSTHDADEFAAANIRLQRGWGMFLFRAALKLFSVRVEATGLEQLEPGGPCLFMVRHASTLDTLLPLVVDPQRAFRYVLKEELLVDPCLDVVGHRLRNCFVRRGGDRSDREVRRVINLSRDVGDDEAIVIFPEGTRFTPAKRARFIASGRADELTSQLAWTLSPLRAGAVALGCHADRLDIAIIAHSGIDRAATLGDLLFGGLTRATLRVKLWRTAAEDVPRDEQGFREWLADQWKLVDAFVAQH